MGYKALARGLSDIAAMGGEPRFCLLSLAVPRWADQAWVDRFYKGFLALATRFSAPLAGGDLARTKKFACDVTVCGGVPKGSALLRSGARPGDRIYVSGLLGASASGLATKRGAAWKRHLRPEPRLRLGKFLREQIRASAAMDLSDGLSLDLNRMCVASGVSAMIEPPPLYPGATLEQALDGGEDYELLFTVRSKANPPADFEGQPLTQIGTIKPTGRSRVLLQGNPSTATWIRPLCMTAPDPAPILDLIDAFRRSKAMFTAVRMGIFDRLQGGPDTLEALANDLGADADALERLLDACVGLGLLEKLPRSRYGNTNLADAYLCRSCSGALTGYILYSDEVLFPLWANLQDAVREGSNRWRQTFHTDGPIFDQLFSGPEAMARYLRARHAMGLGC